MLKVQGQCSDCTGSLSGYSEFGGMARRKPLSLVNTSHEEVRGCDSIYMDWALSKRQYSSPHHKDFLMDQVSGTGWWARFC